MIKEKEKKDLQGTGQYAFVIGSRCDTRSHRDTQIMDN